MDAATVAEAMADAAGSLLAALPEPLAAQARFPFDDHEQRTRWAYYPREMGGDHFDGVALSDLDVAQRKAVHRLLEAGLSRHAHAQVCAIMALESVLDALEDHQVTQWRDPARYWVSLFGEPGPTGRWGWRFEGHHVSVHHSVVDGAVVASTPLFLGANPAVVAHGDHPVLRPCGEEEDAARALLAALDADQRTVAVLHPEPPVDFVVANTAEVPDRSLPGRPPFPVGRVQELFDRMDDDARAALAFDRAAPAGLAGAALDTSQRAVLSDLVDVYLHRLPEPLARLERSRVEEAGLDGIHFAWAGSDRRRDPHYYRLHGPTLLVEYDCAQDGGNHVHAVWRDPDRDFAKDVLRAHRAHHH